MAKILISDDDLASTDNMTLVIEGEGHEVIAAIDGQEAMASVETDQPDMVFVAHALPVFSGLEVCEMIRNDPTIPADLPIVMLVSTDVDTRATHRVGVSDLLPKNHSVTELRDMLVKLLGPKAVP